MPTRETLANELAMLGVRPGMTLMLHVSLRRVGPIEGGADALLDALFAALGPDGTLVMSMYADDDAPFDALTSKVAVEDLSVLAEVFRQRQGTQVNDHAAARFGVYGPQASYLLAPNPLHDYVGPGSLLERFTTLGGFVLRLGANVDTITVTHWAEYQANVPNKRRVRIRYVRADIGEQWIESLDDTDGIVDWQGGDYFSQIWLDYLAAGYANTGAVGNCRAELCLAKHFVNYAVEWMETNLR